MDATITDISNDIEALNNKKNIGEMTKLHASIQTKIKNATTKVQSLKTKFEADDVEIVENMVEADYEKLSASLANTEIERIFNMPDIESQIDEYKKMTGKVKSMVRYLENKKLRIVMCDKESIEMESDAKLADDHDEPPKKTIANVEEKPKKKLIENFEEKPKKKPIDVVEEKPKKKVVKKKVQPDDD